jgi:hypothetical protein
MTGASEGLRKALVRGQKGSVLTLPEMSTEELLAQMTDDQKTALAASLNPAAAGDMPKKTGDYEDEDEMEDGNKKPKSKDKKDDENMDDKASAAKAATDRSLAVMASEHFAGREKLAATLLGSSMSSDEIITALAAAPKGTSADADPDSDEDKARANLRKELAANQPGLTGNDGDDLTAEANYGWADIHAEIAKDRQL